MQLQQELKNEVERLKSSTQTEAHCTLDTEPPAAKKPKELFSFMSTAEESHVTDTSSSTEVQEYLMHPSLPISSNQTSFWRQNHTK